MKKLSLLLVLVLLCTFFVPSMAEDGELSEPGVLPI